MNDFHKIRWFLLSLLISLLSACQYDLSPWETDVDCPNMSIEENLDWLKQIEQTRTPDHNYKVAVIGDPQQYPGDLQTTIETINELDQVEFVLLLGDLVETGVKKEFEWACKALSKTEKPVISVVGNHDALSYGQDIWLSVFGEFDYSFKYLGTKFIAYNDNQYEFENVPDRDWLAAQAKLELGESRFHTIGMSHIQPWDNEPDLSAFLKANGFDHMLHAHAHKFQYWQLADVGLPHFVTSETRDVRFGLMSVSPDAIKMEICDPECLPAEPEIR